MVRPSGATLLAARESRAAASSSPPRAVWPRSMSRSAWRSSSWCQATFWFITGGKCKSLFFYNYANRRKIALAIPAEVEGGWGAPYKNFGRQERWKSYFFLCYRWGQNWCKWAKGSDNQCILHVSIVINNDSCEEKTLQVPLFWTHLKTVKKERMFTKQKSSKKIIKSLLSQLNVFKHTRVKITSFQEVLDIVLSFNVKLEDRVFKLCNINSISPTLLKVFQFLIMQGGWSDLRGGQKN